MQNQKQIHSLERKLQKINEDCSILSGILRVARAQKVESVEQQDKTSAENLLNNFS